MESAHLSHDEIRAVIQGCLYTVRTQDQLDQGVSELECSSPPLPPFEHESALYHDLIHHRRSLDLTEYGYPDLREQIRNLDLSTEDVLFEEISTRLEASLDFGITKLDLKYKGRVYHCDMQWGNLKATDLTHNLSEAEKERQVVQWGDEWKKSDLDSLCALQLPDREPIVGDERQILLFPLGRLAGPENAFAMGVWKILGSPGYLLLSTDTEAPDWKVEAFPRQIVWESKVEGDPISVGSIEKVFPEEGEATLTVVHSGYFNTIPYTRVNGLLRSFVV